MSIVVYLTKTELVCDEVTRHDEGGAKSMNHSWMRTCLPPHTCIESVRMWTECAVWMHKQRNLDHHPHPDCVCVCVTNESVVIMMMREKAT